MPFVIEGDEYDTAFFDKNSKFLHYRPKYLIINNIEFDHADIFKSIEDIERQFEKVLKQVPSPSNVIANVDDEGVARFLTRLGFMDSVTRVGGKAFSSTCFASVRSARPLQDGTPVPPWEVTVETKQWGRLSVKTNLTGIHNASNIAMALACLERMIENNALSQKPTAEAIVNAIASFRGVKRRLEHLGCCHGVNIYEDFAHHPTAVRLVLDTLKNSNQNQRLIVAFEPKNATSRRSVFTKEFAASLAVADHVFIGACPEDRRIPEDQRMNTGELSRLIGEKSKHFSSNDELLKELGETCKEGDTVVFMSSGSFSGIQHRLFDFIKSKRDA
jgi:UDP-N-acetylmuramate: L-alanyl-gamma-D-glutamyl-meso-diaminopimelate ligase